MNINEFLSVIKAELVDSAELINGETDFRKLGEWDSLTGMAIIVRLEETYGVPLNDKIFKNFVTFNDIYNYLLEQKKSI